MARHDAAPFCAVLLILLMARLVSVQPAAATALSWTLQSYMAGFSAGILIAQCAESPAPDCDEAMKAP
jgi:hypothetical protein